MHLYMYIISLSIATVEIITAESHMLQTKKRSRTTRAECRPVKKLLKKADESESQRWNVLGLISGTSSDAN